MVSVSAFSEPLAQMLRLVGSGHKYGCHTLVSTSQFEMAENKVQIYKTTFWSSFGVFLHVQKVSNCKIALTGDIMC